MRLKTSLDHLPAIKRRDLERAAEILHQEFDEAIAYGTTQHKKDGRILKIILFGSYARGGWVDDHRGGYYSDYDLLVIVNREQLTDVAEYWYKAEDRLNREPTIKPQVNFIVHSLQDVNGQLAEGRYFFSDIVKDGIALYDLKGHKLKDPKPQTPDAALTLARTYFEKGLPRAQGFLKTAISSKDDPEPALQNIAAFLLHQATESAYHTLLLTLTLYVPQTHNIEFLRGLCEDRVADLIDAWPRDLRRHRRMFQLLKRAYIEARYSEHYEITREELEWLEGCVTDLQTRIATACEARLMEMSGEV